MNPFMYAETSLIIYPKSVIHQKSSVELRVGSAKVIYLGLESFEASADGAMRVTADNVSAAFAWTSEEFCINKTETTSKICNTATS